MPTSVGPNTFGEENLVFGYDTGDTVNSYRGEPTVNIADTENYNMYGPATVTTEGPGHLRISTSSSNRGIYYSVGARPGTWVMSFEYKAIQGNPGLGGHVQGTYGRWYVDGVEDAYTTDGLVNLRTTANDGEWHKIYRVVSNTNTTAFDGGIFIQITRKGADSYPAIAEIRNVQIENKARPTQYAGPSGSRSATQGLIDLTGNSTIDLTNVSFDSNAQIEFDGTDDRINIDNIYSGSTENSVTVECVVQLDVTQTTRIFASNYTQVSGPSGFALGISDSSANKVKWFTGKGSSNNTLTSTTTLANGTYYHVVGTYNGNQKVLYVNGVAEATVNITNAINNTSTVASIGYLRYYSNQRLNGKIPATKIYNRALTASEIKANYNAIKGRFNI